MRRCVGWSDYQCMIVAGGEIGHEEHCVRVSRGLQAGAVDNRTTAYSVLVGV